MQHTAGPWAAEGPDQFGDYNIIAQGVTLAVGAIVSNLRPAAEVKANALMAAGAPRLAQAALQVLRKLESEQQSVTVLDQFDLRAAYNACIGERTSEAFHTPSKALNNAAFDAAMKSLRSCWHENEELSLIDEPSEEAREAIVAAVLAGLLVHGIRFHNAEDER